jgi:GNAT superfamily N-acetyltransferase
MQMCDAGDDQVIIRKAIPADFEAWRVLWDGYNAFYGRVGNTALPDEVTHTTWLRFFDAYEPMHAFVAERANRLIGLAHCLFHRSTIQLQPSCYLQDVFTVESARGKGVARLLIEEVCAYAKQQEIGRVYWPTSPILPLCACTTRSLKTLVLSSTENRFSERLLLTDSYHSTHSLDFVSRKHRSAPRR